MKLDLIEFVSSAGHAVVDCGAGSEEPSDYPDFAEAVGRAILEARAERGLLVCGSGVGASVAANKLPGIRAALCHDSYSAHQGVEHDDMNVLVLGSRVIGPELARELVSAFLGACFSGEERHRRRLDKITRMEQTLCQLHQLGQSVWLDYIDRELLTGGKLGRLTDEDGVRGVTSNPTIFDKAISGSDAYDEQIRAIGAEKPGIEAPELYERLAVSDIQHACDILRPIYEESEGGDGFVSLEASPHLACDMEGTIAEVRRLWKRVDRPNLMIKVPATKEGIPAIERLVGEGYNINITLMFSRAHYEAVAHAYLRGIARAPNALRPASVASFFVSRVDTKIDQALEEIGTPEALGLRGRIAVANSKLVYRRFREIFHGEESASLRDHGARVQRVLWGSTSTKNPEYSDILYVEELIGSETVNTMPPATIDAFRDHGEARCTVDQEVEKAESHLATLAELGVDLGAAAEELQTEGVKAFADSFDHLLQTIDEKRKVLVAG
jgi:transaldolase